MAAVGFDVAGWARSRHRIEKVKCFAGAGELDAFLARTDILARSLPRVNCPIAAIYGDRDALYRPCLDGLRAAFAAAAPRFGGLTLIADAGHWVQFERAEAFNRALISALETGGAMG